MIDATPVLLWLVGLLGVGGAVAAFILAPSIAAPIATAAINWLLRCRPCLVALALVAAWTAGDLTGRHKANQRCAAAQLRAELAVKNDDLAKARESEADARARVSALEAERAAQKKETESYVESLKRRADGRCLATDADVRGLRDDPPGKPQSRPPGKAGWPDLFRGGAGREEGR